jgi:uncharacterized protein YegL
MAGEPIQATNDALIGVINAFARDPIASDTIRVCVIGFSNTAQVLLPMTDPAQAVGAYPTLRTRGVTSYAAAFDLLNEVISRDVAHLRSEGTRALRPLAFFLTDGVPTDAIGTRTDSWMPSYQRLAHAKWAPHIIPFGFGQADPTVLRTIATAKAFYADQTLSLSATIQEISRALTSSVLSSVSATFSGGSRELAVIVPDSVAGFTSLTV